jgi:hypothetical protein
MPPKAEESAPVFVFERDRALKKFNEEYYTTRQKIMESCVKIPVRPSKDPAEKLKERLNTYKNVRKMRTDYKNYVRWYGVPPSSISVPVEVSVSRP